MTVLSLAATCRGFKAASCRRTPYEAVWIRKLEVHDSSMHPLGPAPGLNAADSAPLCLAPFAVLLPSAAIMEMHFAAAWRKVRSGGGIA